MNIESIIGKTKEVFEAVYKRADGMVSVSKQKLDITTLENKRDKDFEALGRLCFEQIGSGEITVTEKMTVLAEMIEEKNLRLSEMRAELLKSQNKKSCPECGAAIEKNSLFCNICGVKFGEEQEKK